MCILQNKNRSYETHRTRSIKLSIHFIGRKVPLRKCHLILISWKGDSFFPCKNLVVIWEFYWKNWGWRKNILGSRHCMKLKLTPVIPSDKWWRLRRHQFGHFAGVKFTDQKQIVAILLYLPRRLTGECFNFISDLYHRSRATVSFNHNFRSVNFEWLLKELFTYARNAALGTILISKWL